MGEPRVVRDPDRCWGRGVPMGTAPHDWQHRMWSFGRQTAVIEVCRFCGGRKP